MWRSRYPYAAAARWAAPPFAAAGAGGGWILASRMPGAPDRATNAVICAVLATGAAFLAYAARAQQRPISARQATSADGVVAGISTSAVGVLIDLLVASGAGATGGHGPSTVQALGFVFGSLSAGAVAGGVIGLALFQIAGVDRMRRDRPGGKRKPSTRASRNGKTKRPKR